MSEKTNHTRRSALKQIGAAGGILITGSGFSQVAIADPDGPSTDENVDDGGRGTGYSITRTAESEFYQGSGTSYTSAGSTCGRFGELKWDSVAGLWSVNYYTNAFACTAYELDDGTTDNENLFRSSHEVVVDSDYSDMVSTQPYDSVDWGISVLNNTETGLSPTGIVAESTYSLLEGMRPVVSGFYQAIDLYDKLQEASVDGEIQKTWYADQTGQSQMGHYLEYEHTFPPREEIGTDIFDVSVTHTLKNALYKRSTGWTGNREPTDDYQYTHNYQVSIPETP